MKVMDGQGAELTKEQLAKRQALSAVPQRPASKGKQASSHTLNNSQSIHNQGHQVNHGQSDRNNMIPTIQIKSGKQVQKRASNRSHSLSDVKQSLTDEEAIKQSQAYY